MGTDLHNYRVFISSPVGMESERRAVHEAIVAFNQDEAVPRGVLFVPVGWQLTPGGATRPQSLIDEDIRTCDYFILLLHDRWRPRAHERAHVGLPENDAEEEFELALDCLRDPAAPMRQLLLCFKPPSPEQLAAMTHQLKQVLDFKRSVELEREHACVTFDDEARLTEEVRRRLGVWLRDHEENVDRKVQGAEVHPEDGGSSGGSTFGYALSEEDAVPPGLVRAELIAEGKRLADAGRAAGAESCFALAVARGDDPGAYIEYGKFLRRVGRLSQAEEMFHKALSYAQQRQDHAVIAAACSCLGMLLQLRGDLAGAEQMFRRSFEIHRRQGDQRGLSHAYANLGLVQKARGDLVRAEMLLRRSLAIEEQLGRLHGMANQYCNLGLISRRLGDLARAEELLRRALEIDEKLGRLEAIANGYGNIGLVLKARGDLDGAEECFRRAMAVNEGLGRLEGLASDYGNLGLICQKRGALDEAEKMHLTSLSIEEQLGRVEGMARSHYSLGTLAKARGDAAGTRSHWKQARELFAQAGMARDVEMMDGLLAGLEGPGGGDVKAGSGALNPGAGEGGSGVV
jgi:tetratricopeptide (TPR) repeat protein